MKIKKITIVLILILMLSSMGTSKAAGGGSTGHLDNPSPEYGEADVEIGPKGVQFCINVTVDAGCTVSNITFFWYNYSGGDVGQWEEFHFESNILASTQICVWNDNVSCATENWWSNWFHWMVVGNFTCTSGNYTETAYFYFNPQDCPLFYIYPEWNATSVCPCCDAMCVGISNVDGHNMNLTFYRNDSQNETFYMINKYINISNGTYCFCIDGHMDDIYYPTRYSENYHWYVNVTDATNGLYNVSSIYNFTTANLTLCPCGEEAIDALIEDIDKIRDDAWIVGVIMIFFVLAIVYNKRRK